MKKATTGCRSTSGAGTAPHVAIQKPSFPRNGTQAERLLYALLDGSRVNPLVGWLNLGIYRLADAVFQLRGLGWPVITDHLEVENRFGETCRVAEYRLASENDAPKHGFAKYEQLKSLICDSGLSPENYSEACRLAAKKAGV